MITQDQTDSSDGQEAVGSIPGKKEPLTEPVEQKRLISNSVKHKTRKEFSNAAQGLNGLFMLAPPDQEPGAPQKTPCRFLLSPTQAF